MPTEKYKPTDKFRRTSKPFSELHLEWHIERWNWIGEGRTYTEINEADSGYRTLLSNNYPDYEDNNTPIDKHLDYDIESRGMIEKISKEKQEDLPFGHIDGVKVGQVFSDRKELSNAKVHGPTMAGIWGREKEGSCSIVLSGGYEDDIDRLDYILYTGHGGQDSPGGRQVSDQEFTRGNRGLVLSKEYHLPVRVIRGFQVDHGPDQGYRYDGLYFVKSYERIKGESGFYICRFHLESEHSIKEIEESLEGSLPSDYSPADRTETTIKKINRSIKLRERIKEMYDYKCQVCNIYLEKPHGAIAIGAHIKGLGEPHNGPDAIENMLCLCPNHHDQFDALSFYIEPSTLNIRGLEGFEGERIVCKPRHKIDTTFLEYQKERFKKTNDLNQ
jgi:putative restriction endonuclease